MNIDKCLFKKLREVKFITGDEPKKCDYLIIIPDNSLEIWIELKSSEVPEGKEQLKQTLEDKKFYKLLTQIIEKHYFTNYNKINNSVKKICYVVYKRNRTPSHNTRKQKQKKQAKIKSKSSLQKDKLMILEQKHNQPVKLSKLLT